MTRTVYTCRAKHRNGLGGRAVAGARFAQVIQKLGQVIRIVAALIENPAPAVAQEATCKMVIMHGGDAGKYLPTSSKMTKASCNSPNNSSMMLSEGHRKQSNLNSPGIDEEELVGNRHSH